MVNAGWWVQDAKEAQDAATGARHGPQLWKGHQGLQARCWQNTKVKQLAFSGDSSEVLCSASKILSSTMFGKKNQALTNSKCRRTQDLQRPCLPTEFPNTCLSELHQTGNEMGNNCFSSTDSMWSLSMVWEASKINVFFALHSKC